MTANFITYAELFDRFFGKTVAIVGSAPSVLDNEPGFIDSHDLVVRVNSYKLFNETGWKTDVHYSFYGSSVRKTKEQLQDDGVKLCICKCPNDKFIESKWHKRNNKEIGVDYRYIYDMRKKFWFTDTYIPTTQQFIQKFEALDRHIPTTGIAAIMDVFGFACKHVYITGFDFFTSKVHNVDEPWSPGRVDDPFRHEPMRELRWLREHIHSRRVSFDKKLTAMLAGNTLGIK